MVLGVTFYKRVCVVPLSDVHVRVIFLEQTGQSLMIITANSEPIRTADAWGVNRFLKKINKY